MIKLISIMISLLHDANRILLTCIARIQYEQFVRTTVYERLAYMRAEQDSLDLRLLNY